MAMATLLHTSALPRSWCQTSVTSKSDHCNAVTSSGSLFSSSSSWVPARQRQQRVGVTAPAVVSCTLQQSCDPIVANGASNPAKYGELQGLNKKETADKFGADKVHEWRRSYDIPPPNGESLEMCAKRAVKYFVENVVPELAAGKSVMIAAHGNSLRAIIMYLDKLTSQQVIELELTTGIPMLYTFKDSKFLRRGSPVGPRVAGVYALTKELAKYRDQHNPLKEASQ